MTTTTAIDQARAEAFVGKVLTDTSAFTTTLLAGLGGRLGLWKDLAASGPATSVELAELSGISERYASAANRYGSTSTPSAPKAS